MERVSRWRAPDWPWACVAGHRLSLSCPESRLGRKPACSHAWPLDPSPPTSCSGLTATAPAGQSPTLGGRGVRESSASWGRRGLDLVSLPVLRPQPSSQGPAPGVREEGGPGALPGHPYRARPRPRRAPAWPAAPAHWLVLKGRPRGPLLGDTWAGRGGLLGEAPPAIWHVPSAGCTRSRRELPLPVTFSAFANVL